MKSLSNTEERRPRFITNAHDLVTTPDAIRQGFLTQASAKRDKATPYVDTALQFWAALQAADHIDKLLEIPHLRNDLIAVAGISVKARKFLSKDDLDTQVRQILNSIAQQSSSVVKEEIWARYLLTKGDAFGGQMRNWTGATAQQKLTAAIMSALQLAEVQVSTDPKSGKIQRIAWGRRIILFDTKPKLIDKNIDVILLNRQSVDEEPTTLFQNF